jgi:sarcosine oxidase subunit alpha
MYMITSPPFKRTALHYKHLALGAAMVDDSGWQRPEQYGSLAEEVRAVQASVGMCDISPVGKLDLKGEEISPTLERLLSAPALPPIGCVQRAVLQDANSVAGIEGVCCRLGSNHVLLLTEPGALATAEQTLLQHVQATNGCVHLTNLTSALAAVQLVGPYSYALLRKLTALDLSPSRFPDLTCAQGEVAKIHALVVRADIGSEPTYEIYCGREFGEYLWDTLKDAGQEFNAAPFGVAAQRRLRMGE